MTRRPISNHLNSISLEPMPAKVTHLISTLRRGGAEKQLWCLATALRRRGWPQSVIAFDAGGAWEARLREAGIPVRCVGRHWLKPWRQLAHRYLPAAGVDRRKQGFNAPVDLWFRRDALDRLVQEYARGADHGELLWALLVLELWLQVAVERTLLCEEPT
jgi:hypothetical protein